MNKCLNIIALCVMVMLSSCLKEVTLEPKPFPLLLSNELRLVEIFDDGAMLVAGRDGFYLQFTDGSSVIHESTSQVEFSDYRLWEMNFYQGADGTYYGVNVHYVLTINQTGYTFIPHNMVLNGSLISPGYTSMPDGRLMRADYSELIYNSFFNDYEYFIRLSIWDGNQWETRRTNIPISDTYYSRYTPSPIFKDDNTLYVSAYELFEIDYNSSSVMDYDILVPSNEPYQFGPVYHGSYVSNHLIGFNLDVQDGFDIQYSYAFNVNSGLMDKELIAGRCDLGTIGFTVDRIIAQNENSTFCFQFYSYNNLSEEALRGYVVEYDHLRNDCDVSPVLALGLLADTQLDIYDVAYNLASNKVFLATSEGLIEYDLTTGETINYLNLLLSEDDEA